MKRVCSQVGEFATLGAIGAAKRDIIELAIDLGNEDFVAHRHCQEVLDAQWCGRSELCGRLMLAHHPSIFRVCAQVP